MDDFREIRDMQRGFFKMAAPMFLLVAVLNLALLAGAVWLVVWVLRALGVID